MASRYTFPFGPQTPYFATGRRATEGASRIPCWHRVAEGSAISGQFGTGMSTLTETWDIEPFGAPGGTIPGIAPIVQTPQGTNGPSGVQDMALNLLGYFAQGVLGYAISKGAGSGINRILPSKHPDIPYLWASKITNVEGVGPTGKSSSTVATWRLIRVHIQYETPPYFMLADSAVTAEWQRFTIIDIDPATEFLQRRTGSFQWPKVPGEGGVLTGRPITDTNGASLRLSKKRVTMNWCCVPDVGLFTGKGFNSSGGNSPNIEACVGCVNKTPFMCYPPGTLLMEAWKPTPRTYPWMTNVAPSGLPRAYDVRLVFSYFGAHLPQAGDLLQPVYTVDPAVPGYNAASVLGHQCVPHPTNGKWYRAFLQRQTDQSAYWKYPIAEFNNIFKMNA